jgi:hypothetical protein
VTVEVRPDGGVKITGTIQELNTLTQNADVALGRGVCHAPFLTEDGVAEFVIATELPVEETLCDC